MKTMLMCVMLVGLIGCDDDHKTVGPTSVPPADLSAVAAPGDLATTPMPAVDMATTSTFPSTASVTVGPNNTLSYSPATVDIAAGGTVTWTWAANNTMPHTVTSGDTPAAFASSGVMTSGTFSATFPNAGTFSYFCTVHGRNVMSGTVNVH